MCTMCDHQVGVSMMLQDEHARALPSHANPPGQEWWWREQRNAGRKRSVRTPGFEPSELGNQPRDLLFRMKRFSGALCADLTASLSRVGNVLGIMVYIPKTLCYSACKQHNMGVNSIQWTL